MRRSILAVSAFAITMGAFGQTNTTVASAKKSTLDKILEDTSLGYFSEYAADFSTPNNAATLTPTLWTSIKAKYRVNKATSAFIAHTFSINQNELSNQDADGNRTNLDRYADNDFRVGAETWGKYNSNISYRNRARLETAASTDLAFGESGVAATDSDMVIRLRASHLVTTTIDRLTLTGIATFRKWFFNNEEANDKASEYDLIPTVVGEYAITDKVSAYAEYSKFLNQRSTEEITFLAEGYQELYIGSNISIAKSFNLGIFAHISGFRDAGMQLDEGTALRVQISGAIF
jgi:hypothetical protein